MRTITRVASLVLKHHHFKKITFFSPNTYLGQRRNDEERKVGKERQEKKKRENISHSSIFLKKKSVFLTITNNSNQVSYLNNVMIKFIVPIV